MIKFFKIIFRGCYSQVGIVLNSLTTLYFACLWVVILVMIVLGRFFPEIKENGKYWYLIPCGILAVGCFIMDFYLESNDRYKDILNEPHKYTVRQEKIIANSFLLACYVGIPILLFLIAYFSE